MEAENAYVGLPSFILRGFWRGLKSNRSAESMPGLAFLAIGLFLVHKSTNTMADGSGDTLFNYRPVHVPPYEPCANVVSRAVRATGWAGAKAARVVARAARGMAGMWRASREAHAADGSLHVRSARRPGRCPTSLVLHSKLLTPPRRSDTLPSGHSTPRPARGQEDLSWVSPERELQEDGIDDK